MIDEACEIIEESERGKGESAFPELGRIIGECKRVASKHTRSGGDTYWTIERYGDAKNFDTWIRETAKIRKIGVLELAEQYPDMIAMWKLWTKQRKDGSIDCPGWCDQCEGRRMIVTYDETTKNSFAVRCPSCTTR